MSRYGELHYGKACCALGIADELLLIHYGAGCESSDLASAHHVGASERVAYEALGEALPSE
jgi:hypothetical protein